MSFQIPSVGDLTRCYYDATATGNANAPPQIFQLTIPLSQVSQQPQATQQPQQHVAPASGRPICELCGKIFTRKSDKERHKASVHQKLRPFKCSVCNKHFSRNNDLKRHMSSSHMIPHGGLGRDRSANRNIPTISQVSFPAETNTHKCEICGKTFTRYSDVERHIQNVHQKLRPHICEFCQKGFTQRSDLHRHLKVVHERLGAYKCGYCQKAFHIERYRNRHVETVHENAGNPTPCEQQYACALCGQSFPGTEALHQHVSAEHVKQVKHVSDEHVSAEHVKQEPKNYSSKSFEGVQIKMVQKKMYRCQFCGTRFPTRERFKQHNLKEKHYQCVVCSAIFKGPIGLNNHVKQHHMQQGSTVAAMQEEEYDELDNFLEVHLDIDESELAKFETKPALHASN